MDKTKLWNEALNELGDAIADDRICHNLCLSRPTTVNIERKARARQRVFECEQNAIRARQNMDSE